jgi:toxin ParE1/3/4
LRKWGEQQADAYVSRISSVIEDERKRRLRARSVDFVSAGLFRMREVRHLIYFKLVGESVQVIRVLHDSMDETMHLP